MHLLCNVSLGTRAKTEKGKQRHFAGVLSLGCERLPGLKGALLVGVFREGADRLGCVTIGAYSFRELSDAHVYSREKDRGTCCGVALRALLRDLLQCDVRFFLIFYYVRARVYLTMSGLEKTKNIEKNTYLSGGCHTGGGVVFERFPRIEVLFFTPRSS